MNNFLKEIEDFSSEEKRELLLRLLAEKESAEQSFPLSFSQQRIWMLSRINPNIASYNIQLCVSIKGKLDYSVLAETLAEIVRRHEILRTVFQENDGLPRQIIKDLTEIKTEESDLTKFSEEEKGFEFEKLCAAEAAEPFDLRQFPLFRSRLIKHNEDFHYFLITLHHIVFDGWSVGILTREFIEIFDTLQKKEPPNLPLLEIQYADYSIWEQENLDFEDIDSKLAHLRENLNKGIEPLALPMDFPRPAVQNLEGAMVQGKVSACLSQQLRQLGRQIDASLFMVLLGCFALLLNRYTNHNLVRIGTPIAGRNRLETENLIGCFINTLLIPLEIKQKETVRTFLESVRKSALKSYEAQEIPFEKVVEELKIDGQDMPALMQVMFQFIEHSQTANKSTAGSVKLGELSFESVFLRPRTVNFDIAVAVEENEDEELIISMHYSREIFREATIERFLHHFCLLLETVAENPQKPCLEISLMSEAEKEAVFESWQGEYVDYPQVLPLPKLFEEQAARTPQAVALKFENISLTFAELNERADRIAAFLTEQGTEVENLIALIGDRSPDLIACILGILKAGCAYLPIVPTTPPERIQNILEDAGAGILLTDNPELKSSANIKAFTFEEAGTSSAKFKQRTIHIENLAYVIYTSGSTGKPKGVMNSHAGAYNRLIWMQKEFNLTAEDRVLQKTPFDFDVSVWEIFLPLITGAGMVIASPDEHKNSRYLKETIIRENISLVHFVPPMLRLFLDSLENDFSPSALRAVVCSGEALPKDLEGVFFQKMTSQLYNLYGPTEAAIDVTYWLCRENDDKQTVPIGFPIDNTQIYILDDHLNPVPVGLTGELYIGGQNVARGYLNRPALTAEKFVPDPYSKVPGAQLYKTGDVVRYLSDGSIEYIGRSDFQVKIRGNRIELGEIETVLRDFAEVRDTLVTVLNTDGKDKNLVAFIVVEENFSVTAAQIKEHLRKKLPEYMIPDFVEPVVQFPLTANGKIDRFKLQQLFIKKRQSETPFVAPRTPLEREIAEMWKNLLGIEEIGVEDNFFTLGGHSLLLIQFASRLNINLGIEVPLRILFDAPTIASITTVITHLQIKYLEESQDFIADELLMEIENMSPEEVSRLLTIEEI